MTSRFSRRRQGGFALLDILLALAVLGLIAGLVASRGPNRPRSLDLRAAGAAIAETLREARSRAILTNRPYLVRIDTETRTVAPQSGTPHVIPAGFGVTVQDLGRQAEQRALIIGFAPDGSSSGGAVELAAGERRLRVTVGWLTGRIEAVDVR
jgi:general secretion pathway protein H